MLSRIANSHAVCWATLFVMRLVVVGLLVTTAVAAVLSVQLIRRSQRHQHCSRVFVLMPARAAATANSASIVDIAPNVTDVLPLLTLAPGEHVVAVDDAAVANDLVAGSVIDARAHVAGRYTDITTNRRRILVLQH